ncbi:Octaprenyl-diphosphate synthase [Morganella morganii IS15]|nr:Octaprenyl-diphosphate synthase [Morganella morganii IS15]
MICSPINLSDTGNFNISEPLTVALLFPAVFTTTELNDFNFIAATVCNHFSFNFNTFNDWSADLDVFTICNHQNLVKLNSFTCCDVQLFQANDLTFADPVLFTTTLENRVHINSAFRTPHKI